MKLRIYSLMIALFILGVICGVLGSIGIAKSQIRSLTGRTTPEVGSLIVKILEHRLGLTSEQKLAVAAVLEESGKDVLPMRKEFRERALGIIQTYQPKLADELDESQKKELERIVNTLLETWQLNQDPDSVPNP